MSTDFIKVTHLQSGIKVELAKIKSLVQSEQALIDVASENDSDVFRAIVSHYQIRLTEKLAAIQVLNNDLREELAR